MKGYSQRQAAKITGVPHVTLHDWAKRGELVPEIDDNGKKLYSDEQLQLIRQKRAKSHTFDNQEELQMTDTENANVTGTEPVAQNPAQIEQTATARTDNSDNENAAADETSLTVTASLVDEIQTELTADAEPVTLEQRAERIRGINFTRDKFNAACDIAIGRELIEAKREIGHGNWRDWLQENFQWTQQTANNFMRVAARFGDGKLKNVFQFQRSQLQALMKLPVGEEQDFIDAQSEAGNPVESQSAREVQKNVKAWNAERNLVTPPVDVSTDTATVTDNTPEINSDDSFVEDSDNTSDDTELETSSVDDSAVTGTTSRFEHVDENTKISAVVATNDNDTDLEVVQNLLEEIADLIHTAEPRILEATIEKLRAIRDDLSKKNTARVHGQKG